MGLFEPVRSTAVILAIGEVGTAMLAGSHTLFLLLPLEAVGLMQRDDVESSKKALLWLARRYVINRPHRRPTSTWLIAVP